jgi:DNA (cytosine-5)-methyltransferase 1
MEAKLRAAGYAIDDHRLSPHHFGIPQIRERVFIVGARNGLTHFIWPDEKTDNIASIISVLDDKPPEAKQLSPQVQRCLEVWQEFLQLFPRNVELPSFPIWSMEFGATYPFEDGTPYAIGARGLKKYLGCHGQSLREVAGADRLGVLPSYARTEEAHFPTWKIQFIRQNRALYQRHRKWIDRWMPKILEFPPSLQKFEWNCKGETRNLWKLVIQFRASGVRVKRPTTAPSLVAMTTTQVPIIGWEKRYMTPRECARLQSMDELPELPASATAAFKALGNAVNAKVVELIADRLCHSGKINGVKRTGHNGHRVLAATPPARMSYAFDGRISQ